MPEIKRTRAPRRPNTFRVSLVALMFCLVVGWFGTVAARPFVLACRMQAENAKIEREILELKQENQALRKSIAALNTDAGREREARRLGYVRSGEVRLIIP